MAAERKRQAPILLEKNCEFRMKFREGKVLEVRPEGYFVFWEPWTDPETGECHESEANVVAHSVVAREDQYGSFRSRSGRLQRLRAPTKCAGLSASPLKLRGCISECNMFEPCRRCWTMGN